MNLALWIVAALLAFVFLLAGVVKLAVPREKLLAVRGAGWVENYSAAAVKLIGLLEVLAAVGLILPAVLDIAPVLVPLAAVGVILLMLGAIVTHLRRHESGFVVANAVYLILAGFVAWGRFGPESFLG
jgi:uncharacterized membrane protein YphA (DoxX/SURF4 family)